MELQTKNILKKIATLVLVLTTLWGIYMFSLFGSFGLLFSIGNVDLPDYLLPVFLGSITVVIIGPLCALIWSVPGHRWKTTLNALLLLWVYLILGFIIIILSINLAGYLDWLDFGNVTTPTPLRVFCQVISASLTFAYYLYFTRVIKPLATK